MPIREFTVWLRQRWPHPPVTTLDRLRHTLDTYNHPALGSPEPDDWLVVMATSNIYVDSDGNPVKTGLTWGDLRKIREMLEYIAVDQKCNPFKYLTTPDVNDSRTVTIR